MEIQEIKRYLKLHKITYEELSIKSNIPTGTLKHIFSGTTKNPRIDTIRAIERALGLSGEITPEERAAGWVDTKKISISPKEDDMLTAFRELGKKFGDSAQDAAINVIKNMCNFKE